MKVSRIVISSLLISVLVACSSAKNSEVQAGNEKAFFELNLLHIADQEGSMDALIDAPNLSAVISHLQESHPNTILLSSGDNYIPSPFSNASLDNSLATIVGSPFAAKADILIQNALGVQASALGNHEFDQGTDAVTALITRDGLYPGTSFPYLSTNIDYQDSSLAKLLGADGTLASMNANKVASYVTLNVNGELIGVIGAITPTLSSISSPDGLRLLPADPRDFAALAADVQQDVDALKSKGIKVIILLAHMQKISIEYQLASLLDGVDIIVAGGSDTILADSNDIVREEDQNLIAGEYPMWFTSSSGEPIAVVNTDGQYRYVGKFLATFDQNGILQQQDYDINDSGTYATDNAGLARLGNPAPLETVSQITAKIESLVGEKDRYVLGYTDVFLNGIKSEARTGSTNFGTLSAQANLWYANTFYKAKATISIKNSGSIRNSIGAFTTPPGAMLPQRLPPQATSYRTSGGISQLHIENALTFNNGLTILNLSYEQIKQVLEVGVASYPEPFGGFPQVSGLTYELDPNGQPAVFDGVQFTTHGSRIAKLTIGDHVVFQKNNWLLPQQTQIKVVTLDYVADGGNGYPLVNTDTNPSFDRKDLVKLSPKVAHKSFSIQGKEQTAFALYLNAFYGEESPFNQ